MKSAAKFSQIISIATVSLASCLYSQSDEASDPNLDVAGLSEQSADLGSLQNEMESRVSQISLLKEQGLVGITNTGQLAPRGDISPMQRKMVEQENKDRTVYCQLLAKKYGDSVEKIQEEYAAKRMKISAPGTWMQDKEGDWYQK
tara:strand:+ start:6078 stop:6512 length:435 start_codon:yes stop_codon:yes gene_type:complete